MPWVMFALALLSFVLLCYAHALALGILWGLLTVGFFAAGSLKLIAAQVGNSSRDAGHIITPDELRQYREQGQLRQQAPPLIGAGEPAPPMPDTPSTAAAPAGDTDADGQATSDNT